MQSGQAQTESKSIQELPAYEQIYQIAKSSTEDLNKATLKLKELLSTGVFIDMRSRVGQLTPGGKLAMEGNFKAANFLIKMGANINLVARGAAKGNHIAWAEYYRIHYGASASIIASGAAEAKLTTYVEELHLLHKANKNQIAFGYAKSGEVKELDELFRVFDADPTTVTCGATSGGHIDLALKLQNITKVDINEVAWFAGMSHYRNFAELLRERGAQPKALANGAASGWNRDYANHMRLNFGVKPEIIAMGAGYAGDFEYLELLRNTFLKRNQIFGVWGAVIAGYHHYAERFKNQTVLPPYISMFPMPNFLNTSFSTKKIAMHVFFHMNSNQHRLQVAESLKERKYFVNYDLIRVATKIAEFKNQYTFEQCLAMEKMELIIWYLQCISLVRTRKFDINLLLQTATYLAPISVNESKDIFEKLRFDTYHKFLMKDVNQYCKDNRRYYFFNNDENATAFSSVCSELKNINQTKKLLEHEIKTITNDSPFKKVIERHYKRLC